MPGLLSLVDLMSCQLTARYYERTGITHSSDCDLFVVNVRSTKIASSTERHIISSIFAGADMVEVEATTAPISLTLSDSPASIKHGEQYWSTLSPASRVFLLLPFYYEGGVKPHRSFLQQSESVRDAVYEIIGISHR